MVASTVTPGAGAYAGTGPAAPRKLVSEMLDVVYLASAAGAFVAMLFILWRVTFSIDERLVEHAILTCLGLAPRAFPGLRALNRLNLVGALASWTAT